MASEGAFRDPIPSASSFHSRVPIVDINHMPEAQSYHTNKRQRSGQHLLPDETVEPVQKKQKLAHSTKPASSRTYWDSLSKIWLTKSALRELDRRNASNTLVSTPPRVTGRPVTRNFQRSHLAALSAADYIRSCGSGRIKAIQQFARRGGPDLKDIRGYSEPTRNIPRTMSSKQPKIKDKIDPSSSPGSGSGSGPGPRSNARSRTKKSATGTTPTTISAYSKNFSQHLTDFNIHRNKYRYLDGSFAPEPEGMDEIKKRLAKPRPSLSPTKFSDDAFFKFTVEDEYAEKEAQVRERVLPIIEGNIPDERCRSGEILFTNLHPLTDVNFATNELLKSAKPDIYYGARPEQLDQRVRRDLNGYIVPARQNDLPISPNFFLEVKGEDGTTAVLRRQSRYDGALGARAMHHLQSYGQEDDAYDGYARTITSTYNDGLLRLFAHHVTAPNGEEERPEYHTTPIKGYSMNSDIEAFRQGATAYRNARDWAKEQRDQAIRQANKVAASRNALDKVELEEEVEEEEEIYEIDPPETIRLSSGVSTSSLQNILSEGEQHTLSQTSDTSNSIMRKNQEKGKGKQPRKRQSTQPVQSTRKRGGSEMQRG